MTTSDSIATIGVTILLIAFFLQKIKRMSSDDAWYNFLTLFGAICTGYSSWLIGFIPLVILETVWALVSLFGVFKSLNNNVPRENIKKNV